MLEAKVVPVSVPALTAAGGADVQEVPFEVNTFPDAPGLVNPVPPLPTPIPTPCQVGPLPSFLIANVPALLISPFTLILDSKVLYPAIDCVPLDTIPPLVASAGVNINCVVPLIIAPFAFEVPEIGPTELNPALEAVMDAATNAVVANLVELSPVVCVMPVVPVGKLGVPVNDGEFKFALLLKDVFNVAISEVL